MAVRHFRRNEEDKIMHNIEVSHQDSIKDCVNTLNLINYQLAELMRIKEELEARLNALFEHGDEGQKTYVCDKFKVTIKSGYNYSLNKEEYESIGSRLPAQFNPVKQRIAYDLDKKIIRDAEKYASQEDMQVLSSIITKKPAKLNVKIAAGV